MPNNSLNFISGGGAGGQNVAGYVGEITCFADALLRKNHVWADGAAIDPAQWPELAEYAATAGWAQNEAGQYLTPDLRGRFLLGASASHAVGSTGGEETHTLTVKEMPAHNHGLKITAIAPSGGNNGCTYAEGSVYNNLVQTAGGSQPHNNMPPYYTVAPQIRAKVDMIYAQAVIACPYEVGDILQTKSAMQPSERWPGTEWTAIETFLLGASIAHTAGSTGGEEIHTLTMAEMPQHRHAINTYAGGVAQNGTAVQRGEGAGTSSVMIQTEYAGNSQPHNNMPPYTTVYIWERTA